MALDLFANKAGRGAAGSWVPDNPLAGHVRYQQIKFLARGSYGFVLLALDRYTNTQVALKFIERGTQITKYVEREILNHQRLRHPHIIRLKEVFLTNDHLVLAMEYAPGGDLFQLVAQSKGLSEEDARWFFQQIMLAIDYCHRMGVANRDLKLENTLLDASPRPLIKLADFGFSKDENFQSAPGSRVGTPAYLAPEVISNVPGQSYDAKKADIWSCGVLLYAMVTGAYPFVRVEDAKQAPARQLHNVVQRILGVEFGFPPNRPLSPGCKDIISRMLVADPQRRPSVQEVLRHPWCSVGMQEEMFTFNDPLVASGKADPPSEKVLQDIKAIVQEAQTLHRPAAPQQGEPLKAGGTAGGTAGEKEGSPLDDSGAWLDDMIDTSSANFDFRPATEQPFGH